MKNLSNLSKVSFKRTLILFPVINSILFYFGLLQDENKYDRLLLTLFWIILLSVSHDRDGETRDKWWYFFISLWINSYFKRRFVYITTPSFKIQRRNSKSKRAIQIL